MMHLGVPGPVSWLSTSVLISVITPSILPESVVFMSWPSNPSQSLLTKLPLTGRVNDVETT